MAADHIRNPIEWGWDALKRAGHSVGSATHAVAGDEQAHAAPPAVRRIEVADLREVLRKGIDDFAAYRTDVIFICFIYPIVGLILAQLAFGNELLPMIFPLGAGFALLGPLAAVGLYEMSRRREAGAEAGWADALGIFRNPSFGSIVLFGLVLLAIFLIWLNVAIAIYDLTLGPEEPASVAAFARDVLTTGAGWTMIAVGIGVGFLFAVAVLAISVVSVPLMLDRDVGLTAAIGTSLRAVRASPGPMAVWGLIVAAGLAIGTLPLFLGLIVVMPVLGHATWHLYRRVVAR
jgi:uncharacterized membrane protein